jgi:hypothetical protein
VRMILILMGVDIDAAPEEIAARIESATRA